MTIELNNVSSGYSTGVINDNFQKLEAYINNNVLRRDGVGSSEANQMNVPLDMNSQPILNFSFDAGEENLLDIETGDLRYVNVTGDTMTGPLHVREPVMDDEPVRKIDIEGIEADYQASDANLQAQISGGAPLEASAFSPISWHKQTIDNSVNIPNNQNAWSFGPTLTISENRTVTIGDGSFWTVAEGSGDTLTVSYDGGEL